MIPNACRFGWHRWPKWKVLREGRFVTELVGTTDAQKKLEAGLGHTFKEQERECEGCGLIHLRTERAV
jgi:hypothetical protein